ncbi:histidine kinase [Paenibacillus algorifonticola]|uniref:sensor histidine kinase n=1 Tax=Paenibacillus algorifonticola TaxID=684063 RepID=UPI003D2E4623
MKRTMFPFKSIKHRMIMLFFGLSLLSIGLIASLSHYYYSKAVEDDFVTITKQSTDSLNHHLEFYFKQMKNSTNTLINTDLVQNWLIGEYEPTAEDIRGIEMEMKTYVSFNFPEMLNIFLVANDKRILSLNDYRSISGSNASQFWYAAVPSTTIRVLPTDRLAGTGPFVLSMLIPIYSKQTTDMIGNLVLQFSLAEIEATFDKSRLGKTGYFFITSEENSVVYHPNKEWVGKSLSQTPLNDLLPDSTEGMHLRNFHGEDYLVATGDSSYTGWNINSIVPYVEMASGLNSAIKSTIITFIIISISIMVAVPLLLRQFINPIKHLKSLMESVSMGNLNVRAKKVSNIMEFEVLITSFNKMVEQLTDLMQTLSEYRVKEVELQLRQSEAMIRALQNQINPHLLYNTLDIIKSIAYLNDVPLIEKISHNLADVYRYASRWSYEEVTLSEELDSLIKYLEIIHIRYPKKFESSVRVNEKFLKCPIIKLSIQPIVENAVKYAVEPKGGDAAIIITAYTTEQDLIIEIADNGAGVSEQKLLSLEEQFNNRITNEETLMQGSIGLANVHARLMLKYGEGYGVSVHSFAGRGSVVSIRVPYRIF